MTTCLSEEGKNYLDKNLSNEKIFLVITSTCDKLTSFILSKLIEILESNNKSYDIIYNSINPVLVTGLVVGNMYIGTYDKKMINNDNFLYKIFDLNEALYDNVSISEVLKKNKNLHLENAKLKFKNAKLAHDKWEEIYIKYIDFVKVDDIFNRIKNEIFINNNSKNENVIIKKRLFGTISGYGAFNFLPETIEQIKNRYFIKGRPGTCKSTLMKKLSNEAFKNGIAQIIYPCASDLNSYDMIYFPELSTCFFDSTFPHELFPTRSSDKIIDMYNELLPSNFDETFEKELNLIKTSYSILVHDEMRELNLFLYYYEKIECQYLYNVNFAKLNNIYNDIIDIATQYIE